MLLSGDCQMKTKYWFGVIIFLLIAFATYLVTGGSKMDTITCWMHSNFVTYSIGAFLIGAITSFIILKLCSEIE